MKTTVLNYGIIVSFLILTLCACSKEGDPGPLGPQGAQGAKGAEGPKGETGPGNVIYSDWERLEFDGAAGPYAAADWTGISHLTEESIEQMIVATFVKFDGSEDVHQLPYTDWDQYFVNLFFVKPHTLQFLTNMPSLIADPDEAQFRYVIIPAEPGARRQAPVAYDYKAIQALYNIPD